MTEANRPEPAGHLDGVFGLLRREARILLVSNPRLVGGLERLVWDLPGGTVEPGEGLHTALVREWQEEVGLEVCGSRLRLVVDGTKRREEGGPAVYTWRAFYFDLEAGGEPRAGAGIEGVRWVEAAEAAPYLVAPYHAPLLALLAGDDAPHAEVVWVDPLAEDRSTALQGELRHLVRVAGSAAAGNKAGVCVAVEAALAEDLEVHRIEEALLQVVPYAGFPRAITAFGVARPFLGGHTASPRDSAGCATGPETFERVYGDTAARVQAGLQTLHPDLLAWTHAFAYGRVLARHELTLLEREVLAVGILAAMGGLEDPLLGHMRGAMRLGATVDVLAEAIDAVRPYARRTSFQGARKLLDRLRSARYGRS